MEIQNLYTLLADHQYALAAALVIGLLVRLLKSDTKIPITLPPAYRKYAALGLALAATVIERFAAGATWGKALFDGALAWALTEWGHKIVIEDLRGGRELPIPGLIVPGKAPAAGKPITVPPPPVEVPVEEDPSTLPPPPKEPPT